MGCLIIRKFWAVSGVGLLVRQCFKTCLPQVKTEKAFSFCGVEEIQFIQKPGLPDSLVGEYKELSRSEEKCLDLLGPIYLSNKLKLDLPWWPSSLRCHYSQIQVESPCL